MRHILSCFIWRLYFVGVVGVVLGVEHDGVSMVVVDRGSHDDFVVGIAGECIILRRFGSILAGGFGTQNSIGTAFHTSSFFFGFINWLSSK